MTTTQTMQRPTAMLVLTALLLVSGLPTLGCNIKRSAPVGITRAQKALAGKWKATQGGDDIQFNFNADGTLMLSDSSGKLLRQMKYKWNSGTSAWLISNEPGAELSIVVWVEVINDNSVILTTNGPVELASSAYSHDLNSNGKSSDIRLSRM